MNILWGRFKRSGKTPLEFFQGYIQLGMAEGMTASVVLDQYVECLLDIGPAWIQEDGAVHLGVIRGLMAQGAVFPEERLTARSFAPGFAVDIYEEVTGYKARAYLIDQLWTSLPTITEVVHWSNYEALPLESMPVMLCREYKRLGYLKYLSECLTRYFDVEEDEDRWKEDYREWLRNHD